MKALSSLLIILSVLLFLSFAEAKVISISGESPPSNAKAAGARSPASLGPAKKRRPAGAHKALNPLPDETVSTILTYNQFLKLSVENQQYYITGLQQMMLKLQAQDDAVKTEYQSAKNWLSWLLPDAVAGDEERRCVYAGWISQMNGGHCAPPKSEGCRVRGEVHCNPMVYGTVSCVRANRSATASCEAKKKSPSQIVKEIKGKNGEQDWSNMRSELSSYCSDPRPSQGKVCAMIRNQLARLGRVIGDVPEPHYASEQHDNSGRVDDIGASRNAEVTVSRGGASGDDNTVVVAPASPTHASDDIVVNLSSTRSSGDCNPASLLANLRPESLDSVSSYNFMSLDSAQDLMCSTKPLDMNEIAQDRNILNRANARIRGNDKYANADRRNYQGIMRNFNACVRDAQKLRKTGAPEVSGESATLVTNGSLISIYDDYNRPIVGLGSQYDLEGLLRGKGISLCNIQTSGSDDSGSGSSSTTYAPSGAAQ